MKAKLQNLILIVLIVISVSAVAGTWTSIDFAGPQNTSVLGIDGSKLVGSYSTSFPYEHGFVYDGSTWTTVDYPGASKTKIYGISGDMMVGTYTDSDFHGFVYDGANMTDLTYPDGSATFAIGVDGDNIVGRYGYTHGFLYNGTSWTTLDAPWALGDFDGTIAEDIDNNKIVGSYFTNEGSGTVYSHVGWVVPTLIKKPCRRHPLILISAL